MELGRDSDTGGQVIRLSKLFLSNSGHRKLILSHMLIRDETFVVYRLSMLWNLQEHWVQCQEFIGLICLLGKLRHRM